MRLEMHDCIEIDLIEAGDGVSDAITIQHHSGVSDWTHVVDGGFMRAGKS